MLNNLALLFLLLLSLNTKAQVWNSVPVVALANQENQKPWMAQDVLNAYAMTVFTEETCAACKQYIKDIASCAGLPSVAIVASGSSEYLRKIKSQLSSHQFEVFKMRKDLFKKNVPSTPTTYFSGQAVIGKLTCPQLKKQRTVL